MQHLIASIACFSLLAYLVGRRHGAEAAERKLKFHREAFDQAYAQLARAYGALHSTHARAVNRLGGQRRREGMVGRN